MMLSNCNHICKATSLLSMFVLLGTKSLLLRRLIGQVKAHVYCIHIIKAPALRLESIHSTTKNYLENWFEQVTTRTGAAGPSEQNDIEVWKSLVYLFIGIMDFGSKMGPGKPRGAKTSRNGRIKP